MSAATPARDPGPELTHGLFPAGVLAAAVPVEEDEEGLYAEERLLVASAVPKRRREFAAARRCARALLGRLGAPPGPLLRGPDRAPRWPEGFVGSLSHADALAVAAVAVRGAVEGLGIDVEPDAALEPELWSRICTPGEREALGGGEDGGRRARLVFSAKEALYKCVHPHVQRTLGFQEVEISLGGGGRFEASVPADVRAALAPGLDLVGRHARRGGWILAGVTLVHAAHARLDRGDGGEEWR